MSTKELSPKGRPILTEKKINDLISVPKYFSDDASRLFIMKKDGMQLRSTVNIRCDRKDIRFFLSTRSLIKDSDDFSVVFTYVDSFGREYIIRRYNGNHGKHYHRGINRYIVGMHIHTITEDAQRKYHKDETEAKETDAYTTLHEAIEYAICDLNITNQKKEMT